jgi:glycosyltransferase involved in cell wall biosynthesis
LDSGSTDATELIARKFDAHFTSNHFESFGQQRNFALDNFVFKYRWILFLDADERLTPEFCQAIRRLLEHNEDDIAGYYCCWKMMLEGKWLKYCDNFPKWQFRLVRLGKARFVDFGHGQKEHILDGKVAYFDVPYLHFGFSKGWSHWVDRHNRYSSLEARDRLSNCPPFMQMFSKHASQRNVALKCWLVKVPGWPLLRFLYAYIVRLGFVEGIQGYTYCVNMAYYEFLIKVKMRELKNVKR